MSRLLSGAQRVVYGPVASRRLGRSLGINLGPPDHKSCSWNCAYCQYGSRNQFPDDGARAHPDVILEMVRQSLDHNESVDAVTLSGNTEPTESEWMAEVVERLVALRNTRSETWKVVCLTNGSGLRRESVRRACEQIDEVWVKLDAGTERTFQAMNRPKPSYSLDAHLGLITDLPSLRIQTLLCASTEAGGEGNASADERQAIKRLLVQLRPKAVMVHTLDRPVEANRLAPVDDTLLGAWVMELQEAGVQAQAIASRGR